MGAAVGQAETLGEQRQQATETAAKRGETLESCIAMLEEAGREAWRRVRQLNSQSDRLLSRDFRAGNVAGINLSLTTW